MLPNWATCSRCYNTRKWYVAWMCNCKFTVGSKPYDHCVIIKLSFIKGVLCCKHMLWLCWITCPTVLNHISILCCNHMSPLCWITYRYCAAIACPHYPESHVPTVLQSHAPRAPITGPPYLVTHQGCAGYVCIHMPVDCHQGFCHQGFQSRIIKDHQGFSSRLRRVRCLMPVEFPSAVTARPCNIIIIITNDATNHTLSCNNHKSYQSKALQPHFRRYSP